MISKYLIEYGEDIMTLDTIIYKIYISLYIQVPVPQEQEK